MPMWALEDGVHTDVIAAFLAGEVLVDQGPLQIEGRQLLWEPDDPPAWTVAARVTDGVFLVRGDPSTPERERILDEVSEVLEAHGVQHVPLEPPELAGIAAIGITGLRYAEWSLWATDQQRALDALRIELMGADVEPPPRRDVPDEAFAHLADLDRHLDEVARELDEGR